MSNIPNYASFAEVNENPIPLLMYVINNPFDDFVYEFKTSNVFENRVFVGGKDMMEKVTLPIIQTNTTQVFAGSSAVKAGLMFLRTINFPKINEAFVLAQETNTTDLSAKFDELKATVVGIPSALRKIDELQRFAVRAAGDTFKIKEYPYSITGSTCGEHWESNDCDLFILGCENKYRLPLGSLDMVHVKCKTVEELLLDFDLPCCRAAFDLNKNFYISAHCLFSMLTGRYFVPKYTTDTKQFLQLILKHQVTVPVNNNVAEKYLIHRYCNRVDKYKKRGFTPVPIETDSILPWIAHEFSYTMFEMKGLSIPQTTVSQMDIAIIRDSRK